MEREYVESSSSHGKQTHKNSDHHDYNVFNEGKLRKMFIKEFYFLCIKDL
jgi:hypothetical protein